MTMDISCRDLVMPVIESLEQSKFQFVVVPVCYFVHILTKMV